MRNEAYIAGMADRAIFRATTPLKYTVVLSRNRWREITRFKHPAVASHEGDIRKCLEQPDIIRSSSKDAEVHLYYRKIEKKYLCVVVSAPSAKDVERFIITAYFANRIKSGSDLWTK